MTSHSTTELRFHHLRSRCRTGICRVWPVRILMLRPCQQQCRILRASHQCLYRRVSVPGRCDWFISGTMMLPLTQTAASRNESAHKKMHSYGEPLKPLWLSHLETRRGRLQLWRPPTLAFFLFRCITASIYPCCES